MISMWADRSPEIGPLEPPEGPVSPFFGMERLDLLCPPQVPGDIWEVTHEHGVRASHGGQP